MTHIDSNTRLSIWHLVSMGHELDDLSAKIGLLAAQLNHGHVDQKLLANLNRHIRICTERLEIMDKARK